MTYTDFLSYIHRLPEERRKRDMTLKDVATAVKVSVRAIEDFEYGTHLPSRRIYNRLAELFDWEIWTGILE